MIQLAEIFQNNLVLQRREPVHIWGSSDCEQTLSVLLNGTDQLETTVEKGTFRFQLPPQEAMENAVLEIKGSAGDSVILENVDFGEVWIAGGQSNMEFLLKYDKEGDTVIAGADDPHFRFFDVGEYAFEGEKEEEIKDGSHWDKWNTFTPEAAPWFSAVSTYFALQLRDKLGVPVGIVGCNWGGTSASAWIEEEVLREDEKLRIYTDEYDRDVKGLDFGKYIEKNRKMRKMMSGERAVKASEETMKNEMQKAPGLQMRLMTALFAGMMKMGPYDEHRPGGLYETMLKKIACYTCKGVIWYQGESDDIHASLYARLFSKMIQCWRRDWNADLPFLFVQLASFERWAACVGKQYPILRAQQQKVEDRLEGTHMVSIMDVGSRYDIHPKEKRPVGERLAAMALNKQYGMTELPCEAPRITSITRNEKELVVTFAHAGSGLEEKGDIASLFRVEQNKKKISCTARVDGDQVILSAPKLKEEGTIYAAFAFQPYCKMTLYSAEGLPARPCEPIKV